MTSEIYITVFFIVFILALTLAIIGSFFIEEDEDNEEENHDNSKKSKSFIEEFNENIVSDEFLESCEKAGRLFCKRK